MGVLFCDGCLRGKMSIYFPAFADSADKRHWMLFGFDQFLHQSVMLAMAYFSFN